MTTEARIYELAVAQRLDPIRAVEAAQSVEAIADDDERARARRQLTGPVLPIDPDDDDTQRFALAASATADQIEASWSQCESWVENYYQKRAPGFLDFYLLFGADPRIRQIVAKALAAYSNFFGTFSGSESDDRLSPMTPVAYSTSRPGHRWPIRNNKDLDRIAEEIKLDKWCDLDMSGNGYCIQAMIKIWQSGGLEYLPANYMPNTAITVPFAVGDMVIFTKICADCAKMFRKENKIKVKETKIFTPIEDGFGSV